MAKVQGNRKHRLLIVAAAVLLLAAVTVVLVYSNGGGCDVEVTGICLTTSHVYIEATGGCEKVTIEILDADGFPRAVIEAPLNDTRIPIVPGLSPGAEYTVRVVAGGRVIAEATTTAYVESYVLAAAVVLPNGTILLETQGAVSPCMGDYRIKEVRVIVNGTQYNFTGNWQLGDRIRLDLGFDIPPNTYVAILLVDNYGNTIEAKVAVSQ